MKRSIKRVYHHCDVLEEAPMWRPYSGEDGNELSRKAANLMRNENGFRGAMEKALNEWPYSCEHNLSAKSINRRAWLGHAGCFLELGSPEANTRLGWHLLNVEEQMIADMVAEEVIGQWERQYAENLSR